MIQLLFKIAVYIYKKERDGVPARSRGGVRLIQIEREEYFVMKKILVCALIATLLLGLIPAVGLVASALLLLRHLRVDRASFSVD